MMTARTVTVGATATLLSSADADYRDGSAIAVQNPAGGADIRLGGSGVTTSSGWLLKAGDKFSTNAWPAEKLYAITASTQAVDVFEQGI